MILCQLSPKYIREKMQSLDVTKKDRDTAFLLWEQIVKIDAIVFPKEPIIVCIEDSKNLPSDFLDILASFTPRNLKKEKRVRHGMFAVYSIHPKGLALEIERIRRRSRKKKGWYTKNEIIFSIACHEVRHRVQWENRSGNKKRNEQDALLIEKKSLEGCWAKKKPAALRKLLSTLSRDVIEK